MKHDNAINMQVKYIKSNCTEMQERVGKAVVYLLPLFILFSATGVVMNGPILSDCYPKFMSNGSQCICEIWPEGVGFASNM